MRVAIIGAGHAGGAVSGFLRQFGWQGEIVLIGNEPLAPYHRPPLSKAWLKGETDADSLMLRRAEWYTENKIELRLSQTVTKLDLPRSEVHLHSGETITFDYLVLATGTRARRLSIPGANLGGVLALRDAADAKQLQAALVRGRRLAVIGGGYVGLEVAASARALGAEVVVIEREHRVLARVACEELSSFYTEQHRAHGVSFELQASVEALVGKAGRVAGVRFSDGRLIACDMALVGVGASPNDELARDACLIVDDGVVVDLATRTSHPAVYAIGDVTRRPLPHYGRMHRLESVPNALEQAKQAASAIVGRPPPPHEVPWFWSDQFDLRLQIAGLPLDSDGLVVRGRLQDSRFAIFHLSGSAVRAVEAVNAPLEFIVGRQLVASGRSVDRSRLADSTISMRDV